MRSLRNTIYLLLLIIILLAPRAAAAVELAAMRIDGSAVKIDGRLDEQAWEEAPLITGMTRVEPVEGGPGFGEVEWRVFYDSDALYVSVRVHQPPGIVRAHVSPRDDLGNDDTVNIYLNPTPGTDVGYVFRINPMGVQRDIMSLHGKIDASWDGVWESAGQLLGDGYAIEVRIPFRTLRFPRAQEDWGIGFGVFTASRGQIDFWPAVTADHGSEFSQLALLRGVTTVERGRGLELLPTLTMRYGGSAPPGSRQLDWDSSEIVQLRQPGIIDPGLDLRYAVTSGMTANLTLNPDFSQVEANADQLDYNVRYPLLVQEKRPFFLEGLDNYDTPVPLLYTRSINDPAAGLKFAGKEGAFTVGLLSSWDQDPPPSRMTFDPARVPVRSAFDDMTGKDAITSVARITREVSPTASIGAFFANKVALRRDSGTLDGNHQLGALDARMNLGRVWFLTAQGGVAHTTGGDAGELTDGFWFAEARRQDRRLTAAAESAYYGPEFRAETSALSRTGYLSNKGTLGYKIETNQPWLLYVRPELVGQLVHDAVGFERLDWAATPALALQLGGQTQLVGSYTHGEESYTGTRFPIRVGTLALSSSPTTWLSGNVSGTAGTRIHYDPMDAYRGKVVEVAAGLTLRLTRFLQVDGTYLKSLFWSNMGELVEDVDLARLKVEYSFDARWSIRMISQLNTYRESLESSALLAYRLSPGTALYAGYQDSERLSDASPVKLDRRAFLKFSYLWQL
jgi:hypothetical protein